MLGIDTVRPLAQSKVYAHSSGTDFFRIILVNRACNWCSEKQIGTILLRL